MSELQAHDKYGNLVSVGDDVVFITELNSSGRLCVGKIIKIKEWGRIHKVTIHSEDLPKWSNYKMTKQTSSHFIKLDWGLLDPQDVVKRRLKDKTK